MKRTVPYKQEKSVPYHGAVPVAIGVRKLIAETPVGARRLMSAGLMVELLQEEGLPEAMANRLFSQIRKGAPLYKDWKRTEDERWDQSYSKGCECAESEAFALERFVQRIGRAAQQGGSSSGDGRGEHHLSRSSKARSGSEGGHHNGSGSGGARARKIAPCAALPYATEAESAEALLSLLRGSSSAGGGTADGSHGSGSALQHAAEPFSGKPPSHPLSNGVVVAEPPLPPSSAHCISQSLAAAHTAAALSAPDSHHSHAASAAAAAAASATNVSGPVAAAALPSHLNMLYLQQHHAAQEAAAAAATAAAAQTSAQPTPVPPAPFCGNDAGPVASNASGVGGPNPNPNPSSSTSFVSWLQQQQQPSGGGAIGAGAGVGVGNLSGEERQLRVNTGTDVLYGALLPNASHNARHLTTSPPHGALAQHHFYQQHQQQQQFMHQFEQQHALQGRQHPLQQLQQELHHHQQQHLQQQHENMSQQQMNQQQQLHAPFPFPQPHLSLQGIPMQPPFAYQHHYQHHFQPAPLPASQAPSSSASASATSTAAATKFSKDAALLATAAQSLPVAAAAAVATAAAQVLASDATSDNSKLPAAKVSEESVNLGVSPVPCTVGDIATTVENATASAAAATEDATAAVGAAAAAVKDSGTVREQKSPACNELPPASLRLPEKTEMPVPALLPESASAVASVVAAALVPEVTEVVNGNCKKRGIGEVVAASAGANEEEASTGSKRAAGASVDSAIE